MGKRHFNFSSTVRNKAFFRQDRKCAVCGESLEDLMDYGHHVIPDQSGDSEDKSDRFLCTIDNCVMLCDDCHWVVHAGGLYAVGAVPPPEYYKHSYPSLDDRRAWSGRVRIEYLRIYNAKFGTAKT